MAKKQPKASPFKRLTDIFRIREELKGETLHFLLGLCLLLVSVFMIMAFTSYMLTGSKDQSILEAAALGKPLQGSPDIENATGFWGARMAYFFLNNCFGIASYFIPLFLIFASMKLMRTYRVHLWRKFLNYAFLMIWMSVALAFFVPDSLLENLSFAPGGNHGRHICDSITLQIGKPGLFILILATAVCYLIYLSKRTIIFIRKLMHPQDFIARSKWKSKPAPTPENTPEPARHEFTDQQPVEIDLTDDAHTEPAAPDEAANRSRQPRKALADTEDERQEEPSFTIDSPKAEAPAESKMPSEDYDPKLDLELYKYPTLGLLKKYDEPHNAVDMAEQTENKNRIITILHNFGVEISSIKATVGPTITLYEITPAQ